MVIASYIFLGAILLPLLALVWVLVLFPALRLAAPVGILLFNALVQSLRFSSRISQMGRMGARGLYTNILESPRLPFFPKKYWIDESPDDTVVCSCIRGSNRKDRFTLLSNARWRGDDFHKKFTRGTSLATEDLLLENAKNFEQWMNTDLLPEKEWTPGVLLQCYFCPIRSETLRKQQHEQLYSTD